MEIENICHHCSLWPPTGTGQHVCPDGNRRWLCELQERLVTLENLVGDWITGSEPDVTTTPPTPDRRTGP